MSVSIIADRLEVYAPMDAGDQRGPWAGTMKTIDAEWFIDALLNVVERTDWRVTALDVQRFLSPRGRRTTDLWNRELFTSQVRQLAQYL